MRTICTENRWATLPNGRTALVKVAISEGEVPQELDAGLLGIALLARVNPIGNVLNRKTVATVARNAATFRRIAKENPRLLPLMLAFYLQRKYDDPIRAKDPVLGLKTAIREAGLSEASWRYVVRHGSRLFRIPWNISDGLPLLDSALCYLNTLQFAGLPLPPPPSVARVKVNSPANDGPELIVPVS